MYRAKERGRDNFQLFSPAMSEKALEQRSLEDDLKAALAAAGDDARVPAVPRARDRARRWESRRSCAGSGRASA
jgi:hypothetical protein